MKGDRLLRVYCEPGALRGELKLLRRKCRIELIYWPYDKNQFTPKIDQAERPSLLTASGFGNWTADTRALIPDMAESSMYERIKVTIGKGPTVDTYHIDVAHKNGCDVSLSRDKGDVLSKAAALYDLLGIVFLHPDEDWERFCKILAEHEQQDNPAL